MTASPVSNAVEGSLLLIDSSGERCHAGVGTATADQWEHLETVEAPATEGLHEACRRVLQRAGISALDIGAILACDGPGGTVGLRIAKTLVDVLQTLSAPRRLPLFTYDSLAALILTDAGNAGSIVCAGRRGHWFYRTCRGNPKYGPLHFADGNAPADLTSPIVQLRQRHGREPLFPGAELISPSAPPSPAALIASGYLRTRESFIPFDPQAPEYVRWSGARHE